MRSQLPLLFRLVRPLVRLALFLRRGMTLGVRAIVTDAQGRVLLVRHGYVEGWHLPGGGVEVGQTAEAAVAAELAEEVNLRVTGPMTLRAIYCHHAQHRRDHVLLYRVELGEQGEAPKPNAEIAAFGYFALDALPEGTTEPTRQRLAEEFAGQARSLTW